MAARVFVGNLPDDVQEFDLQKRFEAFGKVTSISIKLLRRPPSFAFIGYEDDKSADDAVRDMNGQHFKGSRLRVEISHGEPRGAGGNENAVRQRGTQHRVAVSNLPTSVSWQDLKDFLRKGGDVVHSDVDRRGNGTASFATYDEMDRAIRKLDDTELKGERIQIREEQQGRRQRDRSPSRGRQRSRSRSYSRSRSRSRSHSRSRSPRRRRYRSRSLSRSPSPRRNSRRRARSRSQSRSHSR